MDYRQGKFPGRSYFGAWDTLTGNDPNENEFLQNECLVNINKLKNYVKKRKCDLRKIRETYAEMDTVFNYVNSISKSKMYLIYNMFFKTI